MHFLNDIRCNKRQRIFPVIVYILPSLFFKCILLIFTLQLCTKVFFSSHSFQPPLAQSCIHYIMMSLNMHIISNGNLLSEIHCCPVFNPITLTTHIHCLLHGLKCKNPWNTQFLPLVTVSTVHPLCWSTHRFHWRYDLSAMEFYF
jgi:hypothetical protein